MKQLILIYLLLVPIIMVGQDWESIEIKAHKITDHIYMLEGSGGNIGIIYGEDGVMMIDSQFGELNAKIKKAISGITEEEIRFLVNTHWHGDHVGGNELLGNEGTVILAHENVYVRLSNDQFMEWMKREVKASPQAARPIITFKDQITFHINGETVEVLYGGPAHTDGDAVIWFKESNVVHMGDTFVTYGLPFIDASAGGSLNGMIKIQEKVLQMIDDNTQIIPGHGPISKKSDLEAFKNLLTGIRDKLMVLVEQGKTKEEAINENPIIEFDKTWPNGFVKSKDFIYLVYDGLKSGG